MRSLTLLIIAIAFFALEGNAMAMHISEGLLPIGWAGLWFLASAPMVGYGIYRLNKISATDISFKILVGLLSAVVFIISCMPIPVPTVGTCSHPCGTGLSGVLLGPAVSSIVALTALLIQALFLAHGGLSTLGANVFSMGVVGSLAGYGTFRMMRGFGVGLATSGFMAGLLADWATYATTSAILALGLKGDGAFWPIFSKIVIAFIPTQLPIGVLEGAITAGMLGLLQSKRPDILVKMRLLKPEKAAAL